MSGLGKSLRTAVVSLALAFAVGSALQAAAQTGPLPDAEKADKASDRTADAEKGKAGANNQNSSKATSSKATSSKPKSAKAAGGKAEAAKAEAVKAEDSKTETAKAEADEPEAPKVETAKAETGKAQTGKSKAAADKTEGAKTETASADGRKAAAKPKAATDKADSAKAESAKADGSKADSSKTAGAKAAAGKLAAGLDEVDPGQGVSQSVIEVAAWVISTADNRKMPFAIVDKDAAQILVFGADGKLRGLAPALIGSAVGDTSAEGVGDRELEDIPKAERTTPAGRFLAGFGPATGGETVLWVDYATAVSIHPLPTTAAAKKEKRKQRLASPNPADNRITHGCINVSSAFFEKIVRPVFHTGGVFYVLPETQTVEQAIPAYRPTEHFLAATDATKTARLRKARAEAAGE